MPAERWRFPRFDLGENFEPSVFRPNDPHNFDDVVAQLSDQIDVRDEGYAIDKTYDDIVYIPETARIRLRQQSITWDKDGAQQQLKLQPEVTYVLPSGYKVEMVQPDKQRRWRLVGVNAEGTLCHKPCTVSGGGKSEISKPISDALITGPIITSDFKADFDRVEAHYLQRLRGAIQKPTRARPEESPSAEPPAVAGFGGSTANTERRLHRCLQRVVKLHSAPCSRYGADRQTFLPTALGEGLASSLQRRQRERLSRLRI